MERERGRKWRGIKIKIRGRRREERDEGMKG